MQGEAGVGAGGYAGKRQDQPDARLREVLEGTHLLISRIGDEHQGVGGEDLGSLLNHTGPLGQLHLPGVGGGEDIGPGPKLQLRSQGGGPSEVEGNLDAWMLSLEGIPQLLKGVGQGRGGEHRQA